VDLAWQDGKLSSATVGSKYDGPCRLRAASPITVRQGDHEVTVRSIDPNTIEFPTVAGGHYSILPKL
jgi:hypothetical protein